MIKGVKIGEFHSITDWNSVLKKKPTISPPKARTQYINIPGRSGAIDLSEVLGPITYDMRTITFELRYLGDIDGWAAMYSQILNEIQGQAALIVIDDDNLWSYTGRAEIATWTPGQHFVDYTIKAYVQPYKTQPPTYDEWKWDPFNFEEDVAIDRAYNITDAEDTTIMVYQEATLPLKIILESTVDATATWGGTIHAVPAETPTTYSLNIPLGISTITVRATSGSGTFTIDYARSKL